MSIGNKRKKYKPTSKADEIIVNGITYGVFITVFLFSLVICSWALTLFMSPQTATGIVILVFTGFSLGMIASVIGD